MFRSIFALSMTALTASFLVPGHYPPWLGFQGELLAALALAGLSAGLSARVPSPTAPASHSVPASARALGLLALVPIGQWSIGLVAYRSDALLTAAFFLTAAWSVVVGRSLSLRRGPNWIDALAVVFAAAGSVSVALQLHQWFQLSGSVLIAEMAVGDRPFGNLTQANQLAALLMLATLSAWWLFERRRLGAKTAWVVTAWLVWGLAMTQSRTPQLALVLGGLWAFATRRTLLRRTSPWSAAAVLGAYAAGFTMWAPLSERLLLGPLETLSTRLSQNPRGPMWTAMLNATMTSPWIGQGVNQTGQAQALWAIDHPAGQRLMDSAHNLLIDLALWQGWPLTLAFSAAAVAWAVRRWRRLPSSATAAPVPAHVLWLWLLSLLAYAMVEFPYRFLYFLVPAGLFVGSIEAFNGPVASDAASDAPRPRLPRSTFGVSAALIAAGSLWVAVEYVQVEESLRRVRMATLGVGSREAALAQIPQTMLLDEPVAFQRFMLTPARSGIDADAWREARRSALRQPVPPALLRLSLLAGLNARPAEAAGYLRAICHMNVRARCVEARESWAGLRRQHPVLQSVPLPDLPPGR